MSDIRYSDKDFVGFRFTGFDGPGQRATLAFGDPVEVLEEGSGSRPSRVRALELFDGERVLVFTHSGKQGLREAFRFTVDADHRVRFARDAETG